MEKNEKNYENGCMDILDDKGEFLGSVCVLKGKDLGKSDIIFMPINEENNSFSVRSVTELANKMTKEMIPLKQRKEVLNFASDRLWYLENKLEIDKKKLSF